MEFLASLLKRRLNFNGYRALFSRYALIGINYCRHAYKLVKKNMARCDLCNNHSNGKFICQTCLNDIAHFHLPKNINNLLLWPAVDKVFNKRHFDQLLCYAPYIWPYDRWLKQFKYQARFELVPLFSELLNICWQDHLKHSAESDVVISTCITSVPIHFNKWKSRGFNQAHLIAKHFAKSNHLPYFPNLLSRVKHGESQVGQSGAQRRKNLAKAFTVKTETLKNFQHIIIIDDVITTGTTANEISRILKKEGVTKVTIMTLALSLPIK